MSMARRMHLLTATAVTRLATQPGKHHDGQGLYLQVRPPKSDSKSVAPSVSWLYRYTRNHKAHALGLGAFPVISLGEARKRAADARHKVALGTDPIEQKRAQVASVRGAVTFKQAADAFIKSHRPAWKSETHAEQWEQSLRDYVFPAIGDKSVAAITTDDVLQILRPLWATKVETGSRLRNRIELILDAARAQGYRSGENPARWRGHLDKLLPKKSKVREVKHHPALDWRDIPTFVATLRQREGTRARALELAILTGGRTDEVLKAPWREFDLDARLWTIPGGRMKNSKVHRVSLSGAAVNILQSLPRDGEFVFTDQGRRLPRNALRKVCNAIVPKEIATPHGMRATFRTWVAEATSYPPELGEMAISHTVGDATERSYQRSDLVEKRRSLMNDWAKFCKGEV
jgi:integrase